MLAADVGQICAHQQAWQGMTWGSACGAAWHGAGPVTYVAGERPPADLIRGRQCSSACSLWSLWLKSCPMLHPNLRDLAAIQSRTPAMISSGAESRGTGRISCCPFNQNDADWHPFCAGNVVTTLLKLQPSTAPTVRAPSLTQAQSAAPVLALSQLPCQVSSQCCLQELLEHLPPGCQLKSATINHVQAPYASWLTGLYAFLLALIHSRRQTDLGSCLEESAHEKPPPRAIACAACFTALWENHTCMPSSSFASIVERCHAHA